MHLRITNMKYLSSYILSRRVLARESIVPPFSPGEDTIFTIIVDNVQYPLVKTYPGRARLFKEINRDEEEGDRRRTTGSRLRRGGPLRSLDRNFGLHLRID